MEIVFAPLTAMATPFTPKTWRQTVTSGPLQGQLKQLNSTYDVNSNFIDDRLEALPQIDLVGVVLKLNQCMTPTQIESEFGTFGDIIRRAQFVTSIQLDNVPASQLPDLASNSNVAMVDRLLDAEVHLDVSTKSIRARQSNIFAGQSARDLGLTGEGVAIAIMDTGIMNDHQAFAGNRFVAGFNPTAPIAEREDDPIDDNTHGTHVAGIAFGNNTAETCHISDDGSVNNCEGVAPGASFYDVKVCDQFGTCFRHHIEDGLDTILARQGSEAWQVDIVNMSLGSIEHGQDGSDTITQTIDSLVHAGINVVVSAGNDARNAPPEGGFGFTAASAEAITVGATDTQETIQIDDDTVSASSNFGPRANDNDGDPIDELKPDIVAPGCHDLLRWETSKDDPNIPIESGILSSIPDLDNEQVDDLYEHICGTSMSAPHVAGTVALMLEVNPGLPPADVKDLLKRTALSVNQLPNLETNNNHPDSPDDLDYDVGSGRGLIDARAAVLAAMNTQTDTKFPGCLDDVSPGAPCLLSDPTLPPWGNSIDITLQTHAVDGVDNEIRVAVQNNGNTDAFDVQVDFRIYKFTAGIGRYYELGSTTVNVPAGQTIIATHPWTPELNEKCIQVQIVYGPDVDHTNNITQLNLSVKAQNSPVEFAFDVENNRLRTMQVDLQISSDNPNWTCSINRNSFVMHPFHSCPENVVAVLDPENSGVSEPFPALQSNQFLLGGVTIESHDPVIGDISCNIRAVATHIEPDQVHVVGPVPNQVAIDDKQSFAVSVQKAFNGLPGMEVEFTKLLGNFSFTGGVKSADGSSTMTVSDQNGDAHIGFKAGAPGLALVKISAGEPQVSAYSVFFVTP